MFVLANMQLKQCRYAEQNSEGDKLHRPVAVMTPFKHIRLLVIYVSLAQIQVVYSTIWIKNLRLQGLAAATAGKECLATLTKGYFYSENSTRPKNIVVTYTYNISLPASEIQQRYLTWLHHSIVKGEIDG